MEWHKKLKVLVDVGVGRKVEKWLVDNGYNTKNVRDIDPRMLDRHILKIAVTEKRMVITMDKDFGELVYNSGLAHGGVLLLRIEDARSNEKVKIIADILETFEDKLIYKFCVFKDGRLRIRK